MQHSLAPSAGAFALPMTPRTRPAFMAPPRTPLHPAAPSRVRGPPLPMTSDDFGLTDDGDFAIFGVNVEETSEDETSGGNISGQSVDASVNTGTSIGWQGVGGMLFNEPLLQSGRVDLGAGSDNRFRDFRGNDIVPKVDPAVKKWLRETLPSLDEGDLNAYAEGLSNIGFNPTCASLCELRYEDLDFMKVLHKRYLYKEITGEEHPFEP